MTKGFAVAIQPSELRKTKANPKSGKLVNTDQREEALTVTEGEIAAPRHSI